MSTDEDYRLAPIDEDELRLAPIDDEEAEKPIAPDVPLSPGVKLIPVICTACRTRLYAGENQVGLWKKCPDCFRLTQISAAEPEFPLVADDPETAGGYELRESEVGKRETFRLGIDYRTLEEDRGEKRDIQRHFADQSPKLERLFNNLLTTKEEKEEERQTLARERKIAEEVEAVKRATREGRLEEHLGHAPGDSLATRLEARRRAAEAAEATAKGIQPSRKTTSFSPPPSPPPPLQQPPALRLYPGSKTTELRPEEKKASDAAAFFAALDAAISEVGQEEKRPGFFSPFLAPSSRARMIVFLGCGLIGNFFGEKARAAVWRVLGETDPGSVFSAADQGFFLGSFWIGAVGSVVWLAMLFLFGISIFLETAKGKHRIDHWVPFNLDFGLSYFGWSFLMLLLSAFPGFLVWQTLRLGTEISSGQSLAIFLVSQFLCFPLLFLCVIESDTFFGAWPHKTLASLRQRVGLWLRFYIEAAFIVGVPSLAIVCLYAWGMLNAESDFAQSTFYSLLVGAILTLGGLFPLFYFRRLGLLAADVR